MGSGRIAAIVAGLVITVVHAAAAQRDDDAPPPPERPRRSSSTPTSRGPGKGRQLSRRNRQPDELSGKRPPQDDDQGRPRHATRPSSCTSSPTIPIISPSSTSPSWPRTAMPAPASRSRGRRTPTARRRRTTSAASRRSPSSSTPRAPRSIRVEAISRGHGVDLQAGYPQMSFKVRPGLNTYEVALKTLVAARVGRREARSQEDPAEADRPQHQRVFAASSRAGPPRGC